MVLKTVLGVILVVLILAGAFFFFRNPATGTTGNVVVDAAGKIVAYVNDHPITQKEVEKAQDYIKAQTGKTINQTEALKNVISQKLILEEAEKHGFNISIEETEMEIARILSTRNQTLDDFRNRVASRGQDYKVEIENYRKGLLVDKYLSAAITQPNVTDAQALSYYNQNKAEMFTGNSTVVPYEKIADKLKLALEKKQGQEEITAYLATLYKTANITYVK